MKNWAVLGVIGRKREAVEAGHTGEDGDEDLSSFTSERDSERARARACMRARETARERASPLLLSSSDHLC